MDRNGEAVYNIGRQVGRYNTTKAKGSSSEDKASYPLKNIRPIVNRCTSCINLHRQLVMSIRYGTNEINHKSELKTYKTTASQSSYDSDLETSYDSSSLRTTTVDTATSTTSVDIKTSCVILFKKTNYAYDLANGKETSTYLQSTNRGIVDSKYDRRFHHNKRNVEKIDIGNLIQTNKFDTSALKSYKLNTTINDLVSADILNLNTLKTSKSPAGPSCSFPTGKRVPRDQDLHHRQAGSNIFPTPQFQNGLSGHLIKDNKKCKPELCTLVDKSPWQFKAMSSLRSPAVQKFEQWLVIPPPPPRTYSIPKFQDYIAIPPPPTSSLQNCQVSEIKKTLRTTPVEKIQKFGLITPPRIHSDHKFPNLTFMSPPRTPSLQNVRRKDKTVMFQPQNSSFQKYQKRVVVPNTDKSFEETRYNPSRELHELGTGLSPAEFLKRVDLILHSREPKVSKGKSKSSSSKDPTSLAMSKITRSSKHPTALAMSKITRSTEAKTKTTANLHQTVNLKVGAKEKSTVVSVSKAKAEAAVLKAREIHTICSSTQTDTIPDPIVPLMPRKKIKNKSTNTKVSFPCHYN